MLVIALVFVIIGAKSKLVAEGDVEIVINEEKKIHVPSGSKLLTALADNGLFVSSACGGGGTSGQCKVKVNQAAAKFCPLELDITKREAARQRFGRQVSIKHDMEVEVEDSVFGVKNGNVPLNLTTT